MAKKRLILPSKANPVSQLLIAGTILVLVAAAYEAVSGNDITSLAPTQLVIAAAVLGILGLYLKDEK
jgi:uncharacterized membrane protein